MLNTMAGSCITVWSASNSQRLYIYRNGKWRNMKQKMILALLLQIHYEFFFCTCIALHGFCLVSRSTSKKPFKSHTARCTLQFIQHADTSGSICTSICASHVMLSYKPGIARQSQQFSGVQQDQISRQRFEVYIAICQYSFRPALMTRRRPSAI